MSEECKWLCDYCEEVVLPQNVASDERHDERAGGCGRHVYADNGGTDCMVHREQVAEWILSLGLATGHGDTLADLLSEAGAQITTLQSRLTASEAECARLRDEMPVCVGYITTGDAEALRKCETNIDIDDGVEKHKAFVYTRPIYLDPPTQQSAPKE